MCSFSESSHDRIHLSQKGQSAAYVLVLDTDKSAGASETHQGRERAPAGEEKAC
jgi:hypothetical protein